MHCSDRDDDTLPHGDTDVALTGRLAQNHVSTKLEVQTMIRCTAQILTLVFLTSTANAAQSLRSMTALDLVSMDRVSDPQPSPDGRRVAFVVSSLDVDADRRRTDIRGRGNPTAKEEEERAAADAGKAAGKAKKG